MENSLYLVHVLPVRATPSSHDGVCLGVCRTKAERRVGCIGHARIGSRRRRVLVVFPLVYHLDRATRPLSTQWTLRNYPWRRLGQVSGCRCNRGVEMGGVPARPGDGPLLPPLPCEEPSAVHPEEGALPWPN